MKLRLPIRPPRPRKLAILIAALTLSACATASAPSSPAALSMRPTVPRLAPVPPEERDAAQQKMMQGKGNANIYTTLARHPQLADAWTPLSNYLFNASSLTPRYREMIILRTSWLCWAQYDWGQHSGISQRNGLNEADVARVAQGPTADGWTDLERQVLKAADEVRYNGAALPETWRALKTALGEKAATEAVMTAAQYQMTSMLLNSAGVQPDANVRYRLPASLAAPAPASRPARGVAGRPPGEALAVSPAVAQGLATLDQGLAQAGLSARARAILALRTDWLSHADAEWSRRLGEAKGAGLSSEEISRIARGPSAKGWSEPEQALLLAADDLRREAFVTDATWTMLARHYDKRTLMEILYAVGDATLAAVASDSFT